MSNINFKSSFLSQVTKAMSNNDDMTIGEIIFSAFHKDNMKGKHFFYATDSEMFSAIENFNNFENEEDEPLNEQDFLFWVEKQ